MKPIALARRVPYSEQVYARTWKTWLFPGALLLALAVVAVNSSLFTQVAPSLGFFYVAVFTTGLLLAWRFNSSRILFSLLTLLLAHRAVDFFAFSPVHAADVHSGPGRTAVVLAAFLVSLNFIVFAQMRERGFVIAGIAPRFGLLFLESVVFAVMCRPENSLPASLGPIPAIPPWTWLVLAAAISFFIYRFVQTRKPIEPGFVWVTVAIFLWLQFAPVGKASDAYVATAALILAASLIETSYVLAYHDELTGIRGRRAFNESLLSLDQQYAIAIIDIDHFKNFNDTYGHDTGDQVLCMVAKRLADVGGDGQAFRCGGEEFAIVFRGSSAKEAFEHLETLRRRIEQSAFHVRGADRRAQISNEKRAAENSTKSTRANRERRTADKSDRRRPVRRRSSARRNAAQMLLPLGHQSSHLPDHLSVTVSIGVAEPGTRNRQPEQVIQAADQALYRAKENGRNRVELASIAPLKLAEGKPTKAARG